jgi:DNA-binding transcriptional LysR family regulator
VERARQDVGIAAGYQGTLTVGGRFGLWEGLLLEWLPLMRRMAPDISVRAEIGFEEDLMQGLVEGRIDIGVMYAPQSRPGLTVERLLEERLVLVSTKENGDAQPDEDYVYIDWGPEFYAQHSVHFPDYAGAGVVASIGWLGLQHVLQSGGSGYFPLRLVAPQVESGRFYRRPLAPEFRLPAYAVSPDEPGSDAVRLALGAMRQIATAGEAKLPMAVAGMPCSLEACNHRNHAAEP